MDQLALLTPVLILIIWTFIIFLIMAFGRVSFMNNPQDAADSKDYKNQLPAWVNRTADNYNHLFEQPVAFYAVTLSIALINNFNILVVQLAWAYVILRIIHSLIQSIYNNVMHRFIVFFISGILIGAMAIIEILNWI